VTRGGWHPRGPVRWENWRKAKPGVTRVRHVRSGATGTFVRFPRTQLRGRNPGYAVIEWDVTRADGTRFATSVGRVVAYAFDLEELEGGEG
jgi:hypothetical protein